MGHEISRNEKGEWWCDTENVISEECSDENRCSYECCCNGYKFVDEGIVDGVQYVTVLNYTDDPLDYNVSAEDAAINYGFEGEFTKP